MPRVWSVSRMRASLKRKVLPRR